MSGVGAHSLAPQHQLPRLYALEARLCVRAARNVHTLYRYLRHLTLNRKVDGLVKVRNNLAV